MVYAVIKVNENPELLPGLKLAVDIEDTCTNVQAAMKSYLGLDFVNNMHIGNVQQTSGSTLHMEKAGPIFAIIGTTKTTISHSISKLSSLFGVPVISYVSSSPVLSNKERFKSFFRTVPHDGVAARLIYELLKTFNWDLISAVYSDTEYAHAAFEIFKHTLEKAKGRRTHKKYVCLGYSEQLSAEKSKLDKMFAEITKLETAKVVVIFAHENDVELVLRSALERNVTDKIWVLFHLEPTSKLFYHKNLTKLSDNVITISYKGADNTQLIQFAIDNMVNKRSLTERQNPSLWTIVPGLKLLEREFRNKSVEELARKIPSTVSYVIDAVMAAANALHIALNCSKDTCLKKKSFTQK